MESEILAQAPIQSILPQFQPTSVAVEPAPFPSEVADISSIGIVDSGVPFDFPNNVDNQDAFYPMHVQCAQNQAWVGYPAATEPQLQLENPFQKVLLVLANVTKSMNPASMLTADDLLGTLDTILGQNAMYQQQLAQSGIPDQGFQQAITKYHMENQRLHAIILEHEETHSAQQVQINALIKEVRNLEQSKAQELQLAVDAHHEELSTLKTTLNEQKLLYERELERLTVALKEFTEKELISREAQTDISFELKETLRLSGLISREAPMKSALKSGHKKQLGSAHVIFDLEESKHAKSAQFEPLHTAASEVPTTARATSTVHIVPNIEYDLMTDDILLSQLQESLKQTDGDALKAIQANMEKEVAQLKHELEQVQAQALIMIQQSDQEKTHISAELARLQKTYEEQQFKLEEIQCTLYEAYDSLESAKEEVENERNQRLKLEQDYAEVREKDRSAEMEREHDLEIRIEELVEENKQLGNRWAQLRTEYDELHHEYRTVIDVLSDMQGKTLASHVAENAAADLLAIGKCISSGTVSRVTDIPLADSAALLTSVGLGTPTIGSVPFIDRCVEARPDFYSISTQTVAPQSDSPSTSKHNPDTTILITELELALNETNNALKQRITETVEAEKQITELKEQLRIKTTELEDATMEISLLKLELEDTRKSVQIMQGRVQRTQQMCSTTLEKSKAELKEAQKMVNSGTNKNCSSEVEGHTADTHNASTSLNKDNDDSDLSIGNLTVAAEHTLSGKQRTDMQTRTDLRPSTYVAQRFSISTKEKEVRRLSAILNIIGDEYLPRYPLTAEEHNKRRLSLPSRDQTSAQSPECTRGYRERTKPLYSDSELSDMSQNRIDSQCLEELQEEMQQMKRLINESTERESHYKLMK